MTELAKSAENYGVRVWRPPNCIGTSHIERKKSSHDSAFTVVCIQALPSKNLEGRHCFPIGWDWAAQPPREQSIYANLA